MACMEGTFSTTKAYCRGKGAVGFLGATGTGVGTGVFVGAASVSFSWPDAEISAKAWRKVRVDDALNNGYYDIELFGKHPTNSDKNVRVRVKGDKDRATDLPRR